MRIAEMRSAQCSLWAVWFGGSVVWGQRRLTQCGCPIAVGSTAVPSAANRGHALAANHGVTPLRRIREWGHAEIDRPSGGE